MEDCSCTFCHLILFNSICILSRFPSLPSVILSNGKYILLLFFVPAEANLFDRFLKSSNISALQPPLKQTFHLETKPFGKYLKLWVNPLGPCSIVQEPLFEARVGLDPSVPLQWQKSNHAEIPNFGLSIISPLIRY